MNHRDIWFVGLLALAYLYLDASAPEARRAALAPPQDAPPLDPEPSEEPVGYAYADACPRDPAHAVSLRGDGAKWCLTCDEGFYPVAI